MYQPSSKLFALGTVKILHMPNHLCLLKLSRKQHPNSMPNTDLRWTCGGSYKAHLFSSSYSFSRQSLSSSGRAHSRATSSLDLDAVEQAVKYASVGAAIISVCSPRRSIRFTPDDNIFNLLMRRLFAIRFYTFRQLYTDAFVSLTHTKINDDR